MSTFHQMPVDLVGSLRLAEVESPLGPRLALEIALTLPSLGARILRRSQPRGAERPASREIATVTLLPPGEHMSFGHAPVRGLPGHPGITLQFLDEWQASLSDPFELECTPGSRRLSARFAAAVEVAAWFSAVETSARDAMVLQVHAEIVFTRGVTGKVAFHPRGLGAAPSPRTLELPLVRPGKTFSARSQSITVRDQRDAWLSLRFLDESSQFIGEEKAIGRWLALS